MVKVKALLVGCSYNGQDCEMKAGKHDVMAMKDFIQDNFVWRNTRVLYEGGPHHRKPTRENIIRGFKWLVEKADPDEDHLFFYFAGHGGLKHGISHILPVDHEEEGNITAARMRKELVDSLDSGQQLTAFFQHCHSGNSLELPYVCKKPDDLENGNFSRSSFKRVEDPLVICFGASNLKLSAYHNSQMSLVTKALIHKWEENASILDVFNAIEDGDHRGKPEFSSSFKVSEDATFLDTD
ncbi:peptidase C14, caspase domain-containing protein [Mycena galopus ATCC 62051]|nr:peptidase C14, caspase domain-containing protein [Mycena galopus ATCC 62051]